MGQDCLDCGQDIVHDERCTLLCLDCIVIRLIDADIIPSVIKGKKVDTRENRRPADGPLKPSVFDLSRKGGG